MTFFHLYLKRYKWKSLFDEIRGMSFTGQEDHSISLAEAASMTKKFRDNNPGDRLGGFFGKDALLAILNQENCVGIRFYNAEDANGEHTLVLVGAKADQDDIESGVLADHSLPDPPYSAPANQLNS